MKRKVSVMLAVASFATAASSTPSASLAHHQETQPTFKKQTFTERMYPLLHRSAKLSKRGLHAGRNVLDHGRPQDGRPSHSLLRKEAHRLWVALHPGNEREHARRAQARAQATVLWGAHPADTHLRSIMYCESGGRLDAIGGGGAFRGAFQFMQSTWESVGGTGDPAAASLGEQLKRARILYDRAGPGQWPVCSQR